MLYAKTLSVALVASLSLFGGTGCVKQMILDGQIASTRKASVAVNTMSDFEVARSVAFSGVAQFEGMHYLAPDNDDAVFMLMKSWSSAAFAFIEDDLEIAEDKHGMESAEYEYHKGRAIAAYDRAIYYGVQLLERSHTGFDEARKNDEKLTTWLRKFDDQADGENLFWLGYSWLSKVNVAKDDPAAVADLYVAVALLKRSVELDDTYMYGSGHTALGAYHARTALAELDDAKRELDRAIAISEGKMLLPKVQLATRYYCMKGDKENYLKTLKEVIEVHDPLPEARLQNTIAKRRAQRALSPARQENCGF